MRFLKGVSITLISHVIIILVAFLNNVVVTRHIGTEGRGKYVIISNIVIFFTLFFGEGLRRCNTILIGRNKNNLSMLISLTIYSGILIIAMFGTLYFLSDAWKFYLPNLSNRLFLLSLLIVITTIIWQSLQSLYLGLERIYEFNLLHIIPIIVAFLINVIGIYFLNFSLYEIIFALLIAAIVSLGTGLFLIGEKIKLYSPTKNFMDPNVLKLALKATISAAFIFILLRSNIFIINFYLGAGLAGIYSIAFLFFEMSLKLPTITGSILISKTVSDSSDKSIYNTSRLFRVLIVINLALVAVLIFFGEAIIVSLFKNEFQSSFTPLLYLLPGMLSFGCGFPIYAYFMAKGYPREFLIINASIATINFTLNFLLIPKYSIVAAAVINSITFSLWTFFLVLYFLKSSNISASDLLIIKKNDFEYFIIAIKNIFTKYV